jgi:curved DNA-binding protein CbpA
VARRPAPDTQRHPQVLSNPELRAKYDKYGAAGVDVEFVDPSMIFGCLFGSELFEPIVGEFLIAAATSRGRELSEKEVTLMQVRGWGWGVGVGGAGERVMMARDVCGDVCGDVCDGV